MGLKGVLVECDPSIKAIIVNIDAENHEFIIEELDDQFVVIKENMIPILKQRINAVSRCAESDYYQVFANSTQVLATVLQEKEESESDY